MGKSVYPYLVPVVRETTRVLKFDGEVRGGEIICETKKVNQTYFLEVFNLEPALTITSSKKICFNVLIFFTIFYGSALRYKNYGPGVDGLYKNIYGYQPKISACASL